MAVSTPVAGDARATVLVLDNLRPVGPGLRQVLGDHHGDVTAALDQQVRRCGSAAVFSGSIPQARCLAGRLTAAGLTTSINILTGGQGSAGR